MDDYRSYLIENDRRPRTVIRHYNMMRLLLKNAPDFSTQSIKSYLLELKTKGRKNKYLNSFVNAIRVYAKYKQLGDEFTHWKFYKEEETFKSTLSDEEIEAFLGMDRPKGSSSSTWNTYTIFFSILAFTGLRPGTCAQLKVPDVDFGRNVFVIRPEISKTGRNAMSPIPPNILDMVKDHVISLKGQYLFPSAQGGNKDGVTPVIDNVDWHYNFHKRIKILNIKRPGLTPYSLRHSFCTRLLESGVDLFHAKRLMHHSDLRTTEIYSHLTTQDLQEAVKKLPLVRKYTNPKFILQAMAELIKGFKIDEDDRFNYQLVEDQESIRFECRIAQE